MAAECKELTQKQYYKQRHDSPGVVVHWVIAIRYWFPTGTKWYEHTPERVLEYDSAKILWGSSVHTDHKLEHHKPDIITVNKETKECHIIEVEWLFNTPVKAKEQGKVK